MSIHSPCRAWLFRLFSIFLILSFLVQPTTPVQAQGDLNALIKQFEASMKTVSGGSRDAALKLLEKYQDYKHLVNAPGSTINRATVQALDNQIINMCQEVWRDVSLKPGSGVSYVIPVGTLGTRNSGGAYIPGKSDKDFIPYGSGATEAVEDFNKTFSEKFNIKPDVVDVNVLDPTKIETWPDRVAAANNIEKYNTKGGINWLENQMYKDKPNLWRYDTLSDTVGEVPFSQMVTEAPAKMKWDDALGFASDNLRFRESLLVDSHLSNGEKALKTSKYDLRTLEAFNLSGGTLSAEEKELMNLANIFRKPPGGTLDSALKEVVERTGMSADDALRYYLDGMEKLNAKMTKAIANTYVGMMSSSSTNALLREELAASMGNMPTRYVKEIEKVGISKLGKEEFKEIQKLAEQFRGEVGKARFGIVYFNEKAMEKFGKSYDKLTNAERVALHSATEGAQTFAAKTFKVLGYTLGGLFIGYSIYSAYLEGSKGGTIKGILSGGGQAFIELLEWGYPPAVAVDIISRLGAGVIGLGISAYKNDVLDTMYKMYKNGQPIDDVLNTYGVQHYNAGGLRELAEEIRAENPDMTEAEIDEAIKQYFVNRLRIEKEQAENKAAVDRLFGFLQKNKIHLSDEYDDNYDFESEKPEEYYKAVANWLKWAAVIRAQFEAEGIKLTEDQINFLVNRLLNRSHEDYIKAMNEEFKNYGVVRAPQANTVIAKPKPCDGIACLKLGANAKVAPKNIPPNPGTIWAGGGGFPEKPVNEPCDPAQVYGPFDIQGGARAVAELVGSPPVPNTWSLFNANTSMTVTFTPKTGSTFGPSEFLAGLAGQVGNANLKQEFDIPGPGQLLITIGAPRGSGPLTGSCFGQSYSASLKVMEMKAESSARSGTSFDTGDKVSSDVSPVTLVMEEGTKLLLHQYSSVSFSRDAQGRPVVRLEKGSIHFISPKGGSQPIVVQVLDKTIVRKGTEFIVRNDSEVQLVSVVEGSVTVNGMAGGSVTVNAGKELNLANGNLYDYQYADDNRNRMHDIRLGDLFFGDYTPEQAGTVAGPTFASPLDGGWIWQDPGYNTEFTVNNGQVRMVVPHGKCMGAYCDNSPVLMHKVTGDFDLQTRALLIGPNDRWVELDFMLYAPDSFIGLNSKQTIEDSLLVHTRTVGAGWSRVWNRSMLKNMDQSFQYGGKEVPDKPVLLKLTRRGDQFRSYWSLDNGKTWNLGTHELITVPETLYTGWLAIYGGDYPGEPAKATITLSDIRLTSAPSNSLPLPEWNYVYRQGSASGAGQSVELTLDGSTAGDVTAYRSEVLTGDFEVVASYEADAWEQSPGDSRGFSLVAETLDGNKLAFVGPFQNDNYKLQFHTNFNIGGVPRGSWQRLEGAGFNGRLMLKRVGSVLQAFVEIDGEWVQIDKGYADLVSEPVVVAVQAYNNFEAAHPADVNVKFTLEKITGATKTTAAPKETASQPTEVKAAPASTQKPHVRSTVAPTMGTGSQETSSEIFADDFSRSPSTWKVLSGSTAGKITQGNGVITYTISTPEKYVSARVPWKFSEPAQDVVLSVKEKVLKPEMGYFGLFCRVTEGNDFDMVMIRTKARGGGEFSFYIKSNGGETKYNTEWQFSNAFLGGEIEEEIEFSCVGDKLTLKANGKIVGETTDTDIKSGYAVLYGLSESDVTAQTPFIVTFDDFKAEISK